MKKTNKRLKDGIYLLPNLFTSVNLFLGFYSIILTFRAYSFQKTALYASAALAIVIATVFDTLDGRIARITKTTSHFGLEYDSLADLTTFGMAPALLMYAWGLRHFGQAGWLAVFLYFACVALRLARFNVQVKTVEKEYFQGLPCPAAAGFVAALILVKPVLIIKANYEMLYVLILPYLLALLMVSQIRYRNFKEIDFKKRFSYYVLLIIVAFIIIIYYHRNLTIFTIFAVYSSFGVIEEIYRWLSKKKKNLASQERLEIAPPPPENHN